MSCGGAIQAAHCFGRGHRGVRHELWNGWPLCAGHHVYYTRRSGAAETWTALLRKTWGDSLYELRYRVAKTKRPDYAEAERVLALVTKVGGVEAWSWPAA